jgi:predicted permease
MIACANIANLMSARSMSRAREMALRVAIGAGRRRLVQLVLLESALMATAAAVIGAAFAWLSAPLIVGMIDLPSGPARLALPLESRLIGFGLGLTLAVTTLFGLTAALRASAVRPVEALKGGRDGHGRRSLMSALVGVQVGFCVVVLFVAALFVTTFDRLANEPVGFSAERLLAVETVATQPRTPVYWSQVAAHVLAVPGVESVSLAGWPLMSGQAQAVPVSVNGGPLSEQPVYVLSVSPGWIDTMKIRLIDGRDFRADEIHPSVALVNVEFAKTYFPAGNPVGSSFEQPVGPGQLSLIKVIGMVGNAKYDSMREPVKPTIYVPFGSINVAGEPRAYARASLIVRTSMQNPLALAETIRREIPQARSEFYVTNITTQKELNDSHTVRERLLATLGFFFATVALILSSVGVYGVLHYSVVQRRREIGICIALGARSAQVARRVATLVVAAMLRGSILGLAVAIAIERYIENLLWGVKGVEPAMLAVPALSILATLLAAAPVLLRAIRIDPAELLRTD